MCLRTRIKNSWEREDLWFSWSVSWLLYGSWCLFLFLSFRMFLFLLDPRGISFTRTTNSFSTQESSTETKMIWQKVWCCCGCWACPWSSLSITYTYCSPTASTFKGCSNWTSSTPGNTFSSNQVNLVLLSFLCKFSTSANSSSLSCSTIPKIIPYK